LFAIVSGPVRLASTFTTKEKDKAMKKSPFALCISLVLVSLSLFVVMASAQATKDARGFVMETNDKPLIELSINPLTDSIVWKKLSPGAPKSILLGIEYSKKRKQVGESKAIELTTDTGEINMLNTEALVGFGYDVMEKMEKSITTAEAKYAEMFVAMYAVTRKDGEKGVAYGAQVSNVVTIKWDR